MPYWLIFTYKYVGYFKMISIRSKENHMYFFFKNYFYNKNTRKFAFELCTSFNYICKFTKSYLILLLLVYFNKHKNDMYIIL